MLFVGPELDPPTTHPLANLGHGDIHGRVCPAHLRIAGTRIQSCRQADSDADTWADQGGGKQIAPAQWEHFVQPGGPNSSTNGPTGHTSPRPPTRNPSCNWAPTKVGNMIAPNCHQSHRLRGFPHEAKEPNHCRLGGDPTALRGGLVASADTDTRLTEILTVNPGLLWAAWMYASTSNVDLDYNGGPGVYPEDLWKSPKSVLSRYLEKA